MCWYEHFEFLHLPDPTTVWLCSCTESRFETLINVDLYWYGIRIRCQTCWKYLKVTPLSSDAPGTWILGLLTLPIRICWLLKCHQMDYNYISLQETVSIKSVPIVWSGLQWVFEHNIDTVFQTDKLRKLSGHSFQSLELSGSELDLFFLFFFFFFFFFLYSSGNGIACDQQCLTMCDLLGG